MHLLIRGVFFKIAARHSRWFDGVTSAWNAWLHVRLHKFFLRKTNTRQNRRTSRWKVHLEIVSLRREGETFVCFAVDFGREHVSNKFVRRYGTFATTTNWTREIGKIANDKWISLLALENCFSPGDLSLFHCSRMKNMKIKCFRTKNLFYPIFLAIIFCVITNVPTQSKCLIS